MTYPLVPIVYMALVGISLSQWIVAGFAGNELRLADLPRTVRTTRNRMVEVVGASVPLSPDMLRDSMERYRIFLIVAFSILNVLILIAIGLQRCSIMVRLLSFLLYIFFLMAVSLLVFFTLYFYDDQARYHYIYVEFFYPNLSLRF